MSDKEEEKKSIPDFSSYDKSEEKKSVKKDKIKTLRKIVLIGNGYIVVLENGTNRNIPMDTKNFKLKIGDHIEVEA